MSAEGSPLLDPPPWLVPWVAWNIGGRHPADRPSSAPHHIPEWALWLGPWSAWYRLGRRGERPKGIPYPIPHAAWPIYGAAVALARHAENMQPNPLAGVWLFTAWEPAVVLSRRPRVRGVLVTPDLIEGKPGCTPELAAELRKAGYELGVWEARSELGPSVAGAFGASVWLGQAENAIEAAAMLSHPAAPGVTSGAVGNPEGWTQEQRVGFAGLGRLLALEVYRNRQPWLVPDSKGVPVATFVYGLYDATGEAPGIGTRMELPAYRSWLPASSWSGYTAETMTDADWHELGA